MQGLDLEVAATMELAPETPFVVGAHDGVLSNLGVNAIAPGVVAARATRRTLNFQYTCMS